jgi:hypothetical protein
VSPTPELTAAELARLVSADRATLVDGVDASVLDASGAWLPAANPYFTDAGARLKTDGNSVPAGNFEQFRNYVAHSAFVHCGDSWSYLGRAISAMLAGDVYRAMHLCYYSELRAAISLLASEGIYIGNGVNLALTAGGSAVAITPSATHRAAWQCLHGWLSTTRAAVSLSNIVAPYNTPLSEWLSAASLSGTQTLLLSLLPNLAFDLQMFADDRERRNAASYAPTRLRIDDLGAEETLALIDELWEAVEPDRPGGFPNVDLQLLLEILLSRYISVEGKRPTEAAWKNWVRRSVPAAISGTQVEDELIAAPFNAPSMRLISGVLRDTPSGPVGSAMLRDMVGRCVILLRIATGSVRVLVQDSSKSEGDFWPWIESLSVARGLWRPGQAPDDPLDLWEDVRVAREDINAGRPVANMFEAVELSGASGVAFRQAERAVAWSV